LPELLVGAFENFIHLVNSSVAENYISALYFKISSAGSAESSVSVNNPMVQGIFICTCCGACNGSAVQLCIFDLDLTVMCRHGLDNVQNNSNSIYWLSLGRTEPCAC
jgi:hypothetical protein